MNDAIIAPNTLPAIHRSFKRAFTTTFNNLGPYTMTLTTTSMLYSATQSLPSAALIAFLKDVVTQASEQAASHTLGVSNVAEFGQGNIYLGFLIKDGKPGGGGRIPWQLVELLAKQFLARAMLGNPMAFRGVVRGPLGQVGGNWLGKLPYVEVVLQVGREVVSEGINWAIF